MEENNDIVKFKYLGLLTYIIIIGMSLWFYLERTVFTDIAFHLFYILKDNNFAIQNYRVAAVFTQFIPLVLSKLSAPLPIISQLYSASFVVLNLFVFLRDFNSIKKFEACIIIVVISNLGINPCVFLDSIRVTANSTVNDIVFCSSFWF